MQYQIEFQVDHLERALEAARREIATPQQMLGSMGESLKIVNEDRHAQGLAPDGSKWKPLSPMTIGANAWKGTDDSLKKKGQISIDAARKAQTRAKGRILNETGEMLRSFNYQVQGNTLKLGFSDHKAEWHHFGTGTFGPKGKPYIIKPVNRKALGFAGLCRRRVNHPGIPARPLVGFPASDQRLVMDVLDDHLTAVLNRVR